MKLMCVRLGLILIFYGMYLSGVKGQISPGALADGHKHLEGISNCTKCHDLGKKVSPEKCLACHVEVKSKIDKNQGYHVSAEVKAVSCISCHSDHHGLKFEIVHFDKTKFNHKLTGYPLTGKHAQTDCKKCHDSKYITDSKIKSKVFTYFGLSDQCKACHEDVHKGTLDTDCAACHTTEKFIPATKFDHKKSDFPLVGKHQEVDCFECHKTENRAGKKFQYFADVKFASCNDCHENVHDKGFGVSCSSCHSENSFHVLKARVEFDHMQTGYILKGKHKTVECKLCHLNALTSLKTAFQDFEARKVEGCVTCHKDVHETKFGQNCVQCHTEQSFKMQKVPSVFDHDLTSYKLEGKHETVDCNKCHKAKMTDELPHAACFNCHEDYHKGQFTTGTVVKDCAGCHTVQNFTESSFSLEEHAKTKFPLKGAHLATPCLDCHKVKGEWKFKDIGSDCVHCHKDIHEATLAKKYYPRQNCTNCHSENTWKELKFQHDSTRFVLLGKHASLRCAECHINNETQASKKLIFALQTIDCESCHKDIHQKQFVQNGKNDCARCHGFDQWKASLFDHNQAAFKLDGAHKNVACDLCHKQIEINLVNCTQYKLVSFKCIDCHL